MQHIYIYYITFILSRIMFNPLFSCVPVRDLLLQDDWCGSAEALGQALELPAGDVLCPQNQ